MGFVLGIGTDIVKLARFRKIVLRDGLSSKRTESFAQKILHPEHELPVFKRCVVENDVEKSIRLLAGRYVWGDD